MTASPDPIAPTVVVLAAGLGARYGGAKPFAPAGPDGEPLLAYALLDAHRAGAGDAVLVVRDADRERAEHLADQLLARILPVQVVVQRHDDGITIAPERFAAAAAARTTPWGTGHAALAAWPHLSRAAVLLNGDDYYGTDAIAAAVDFARALEGRRRNGQALRPTAAAIGFPVAATTSARGGVNRALISQAVDGRVTSFDEVQDIRDDGIGNFSGTRDGAPILLDADAVVSMNCWAMPHAGFALLANEFETFVAEGASGEFQLPSAITALVRRDAMRVMMRRTSGPWFGLTHPDDLDHVQARLAALVDEEKYPSPLAP